MPKSARIYLVPGLVALGFGALVVGWPYVFPAPSYDDLSRDCLKQCARHDLPGTLVQEDAPASPKDNAARYSCRCG